MQALPILRFSTPSSIGDLLYIKAMLDNSKNKFSKVVLSRRMDLVTGEYGRTNEYSEFAEGLMKLLFGNDSFYELVRHQFDFMHFEDLNRKYQLPYLKPCFESWLPIKTELPTSDPYIVISTKTRYLEKSSFFKILRPSLESIKNQKIVLMGEKKMVNFKEYEKNPTIYSIYEPLVQELKSLKVDFIDNTFEEFNKPNLESIRKDCYKLHKAKCVISYGVGGLFCLATSIGKVIAFSEWMDPVVRMLMTQNIVYDNKELFVKALSEIN